jgi:KaiC/GvpD/RAD55 family RecA-like ATPase
LSADKHEEVAETATSLPFEKNKQYAVLGHLLINDRFFLQAAGKILPEWFADPYCNKVFAGKLAFYKAMKRCPSVEELRNLPEFLREEQRVRNRINEAINCSQTYAEEFGLDAMSRELTEWLHAQLYQNAVRQSARLYNAKKPRDAYSIVEKAMNDIKYTTFEDDKEERFDSYATDFEKAQGEYHNALTFGVTIFDRLLTPKAAKGSLLPGDTSIILAPTNVGKTTSMITVVKHNLFAGKHVLFITHEGRPADIKEKLWCAMLDCTPQELYAMYTTPEGRTKIDFALQWLKRYLTYIPLNKAGLTVEEVASVIRKRQEELMVKNKGKGYALLVNDYPAKLATAENKGGTYAKRNVDEIVYNYFVQLGLEYGFHVLCAIQTNREGSKVNKGQREDRLLTMEDVQESWGPMTAATNVWTINRNPSDKIAKRLIYHIDKSRSSEVGWAVVCKTNYAHSITHSDALGATYFRGESSHSKQLDQYLDQYVGQEMPDHVLLGAN